MGGDTWLGWFMAHRDHRFILQSRSLRIRGTILITSSRNPSLSYTKSLELRVATLEEALTQARSGQSVGSTAASLGASASPEGSSEHDASSSPENGEFATQFQGLKVDSSGRVSFHGPTSFFHLASGSPTQEIQHPLSSDVMGKERLINNAWTARAFERLSNHPVRTFT